MGKRNPLVDYDNPRAWYKHEGVGARVRGVGYVKKWRPDYCVLELAHSKKRVRISYDETTSLENALDRAGLKLGGFRWTARARKDLKALEENE